MADSKQIQTNGPLVLFDGMCNLCSFSVQFLARRDRTDTLWYASVQSAAGQRVLAANNLPPDRFDSFYFLENGQLYAKSDAALRLASYMGRPWRQAQIFRVMPRPLRDWLYGRIARNRYAIFGRRDTCMLPHPTLAARFLS